MSWAGRALGVQNTGQNVVAAATPPVMAQLIDVGGYAGAFGIGALFPLAAILVIPVRAERLRQRAPGPAETALTPRAS